MCVKPDIGCGGVGCGFGAIACLNGVSMTLTC